MKHFHIHSALLMQISPPELEIPKFYTNPYRAINSKTTISLTSN